VSYKDVAEMPIRGYHEESRCWFFKDVVFTPDGDELREKKKDHDIIWYQGHAYKLVDHDHENQTFRHGEPRMHPDTTAVMVMRKWGLGAESEEDAVRTMFMEVSHRMFETIGVMQDGWCWGRCFRARRVRRFSGNSRVSLFMDSWGTTPG
jgi:hypothetical protein